MMSIQNGSQQNQPGHSSGASPFDRLVAKILLYGLPLLILVFGLIFVLFQMQANRNLVQKNKDTTDKIESMKIDMDSKMGTLNDQFVVKAMGDIFNDADLTYEMNKYWQYSLTVNGQAVKTPEITVNAGKLVVVISEKKTPEGIASKMPKDIIDVGRVTGNDKLDKIQTHFFVDSANSTVSNVAPTVKSDDNGTTMTFTVDKAKSKTKLSFIVSPKMEASLFGESSKLTFTINIK